MCVQPASIFLCWIGLTVAGFMVATCSTEQKDKKNNQPGMSKNSTHMLTAIHAPTQYAAIGDKKIAYRIIGAGDPIVLCQRFRGNMDDWDPAFLDSLAAHYQVVIFDYSGFGLSTGAPPVTMLQFAQDVKDLAAVLDCKTIIAGGWSFGGAVAQIATTEFTGLVTQLILLGTKPPGRTDYPPEPIFLETAAKPYNDLNDEIILFFEPTSALSRKAASESHDRITQRTTDKDLYIKADLWPYYQRAFEDYQNDPYQALQKLMTTTIPILVITADHEVVFPPQNWFVLNRQLPTAQVIVVPQSGHGPHLQYPELIANYIYDFISYNRK
jgi:pimeloyl-ACP methyl ester carboxylesterase